METANLLKFNITLTFDAEDLIDAVGAERAKDELADEVRTFLKEESIFDLLDSVMSVDLTQCGLAGGQIPVALRSIELDGELVEDNE